MHGAGVWQIQDAIKRGHQGIDLVVQSRGSLADSGCSAAGRLGDRLDSGDSGLVFFGALKCVWHLQRPALRALQVPKNKKAFSPWQVK